MTQYNYTACPIQFSGIVRGLRPQTHVIGPGIKNHATHSKKVDFKK